MYKLRFFAQYILTELEITRKCCCVVSNSKPELRLRAAIKVKLLFCVQFLQKKVKRLRYTFYFSKKVNNQQSYQKKQKYQWYSQGTFRKQKKKEKLKNDLTQKSSHCSFYWNNIWVLLEYNSTAVWPKYQVITLLRYQVLLLQGE